MALDRDDYSCLRCGKITSLQVHHIHYNGIEKMDFTIAQLETVCTHCHKAIHRGKLPMKIAKNT